MYIYIIINAYAGTVNCHVLNQRSPINKIQKSHTASS